MTTQQPFNELSINLSHPHARIIGGNNYGSDIKKCVMLKRYPSNRNVPKIQKPGRTIHTKRKACQEFF
jgi:hypothetical protein